MWLGPLMLRLLLLRLLMNPLLLKSHSSGLSLLLWRTEVPLFWLFLRFQAARGQESRYCPHHPLKMAMGSVIAAPVSAAGAIIHDSVKIAAAVSTKSALVSWCLGVLVGFAHGANP
ncbi:hypothetical protein ASF12_30975 [Paenibacillus sp. Leaf72]|nr:hypothetical protein ASF12_30975 [Paenibacillus sp. Leaf72]